MAECVHIERMCDNFDCKCRCVECIREIVVIAQRLIDDGAEKHPLWVY